MIASTLVRCLCQLNLLANLQAYQDRWWRRVFAALSAALAAAFLYLSTRQLLRPYDMRHHALFAGALCSVRAMLICMEAGHPVAHGLLTGPVSMHAGAAPPWEVAALELANGMSMAMTGASMLVSRERPSRAALFSRTWRCPAALLLALAWCPAMWAVQRVRPAINMPASSASITSI